MGGRCFGGTIMVIGTESEIVEFKLTTGEKKEAAASLAAMLNKHCKGTVYFGIDDGGFIKGQQISDSTKKDITRTIAELIEPKISPTIEVVTIDGKDVIKVSASGRARPYSVSGKYLMRVGTENRIMSQEDLRTLIKNEDYSSKWEEEVTDYSYDDLDDEALLDFYKSARDAKRLEMTDYDKKKLLDNLGLMKDGYAKNGTYALFGKEAKIGLKLATFASESKVTFLDLKLINGNVYTLINIAVNYILNHLNWRVEIGDVKRREVPEIPSEAIREIVVNAFAHSSYENLPEIEIGIHPKTIEIYNPGTFPDQLTPFDFIEQNMPSFIRNRMILDILFRSKDVEKMGTGLQRVNSLCKENGLSWNYRKLAYGFIFEFVRPNPSIRENASLSKSEKAVLSLISADSGLTKSGMAKRLGKSEKTIQRALSSLISKGLVENNVNNREVRWTAKQD